MIHPHADCQYTGLLKQNFNEKDYFEDVSVTYTLNMKRIIFFKETQNVKYIQYIFQKHCFFKLYINIFCQETYIYTVYALDNKPDIYIVIKYAISVPLRT